MREVRNEASYVKKGAKMKWISVNEKMPESNVEVLLLHKNYEHPFFGQYYDIGDRWWLRGEKGHIQTSEVIHWMPLPPPPSSHNSD